MKGIFHLEKYREHIYGEDENVKVRDAFLTPIQKLLNKFRKERGVNKSKDTKTKSKMRKQSKKNNR
jgi:hypothetical protein